MVIWCFYPLLGALRHPSCTVWRAEEDATSVFWVMSFWLDLATQTWFFMFSVDVKQCWATSTSMCAHAFERLFHLQITKSRSLKAQSFTSTFHVKKSRTRRKYSIHVFYLLFSLRGCKEWSGWIASKHFHFLVTLSATMASTWRCLVSECHRLGRQWLQGRLSEETASSLRQLVADCGAASSSRATKADCLGILLQMFDSSSPVSRRLWCISLFLFFLLFLCIFLQLSIFIWLPISWT